MKLKVVGDGTVGGTKVINEETGEMLEDCARLSFDLDARPHLPFDPGRPATVTVTILGMAVEMTADNAEVVAIEG